MTNAPFFDLRSLVKFFTRPATFYAAYTAPKTFLQQKLEIIRFEVIFAPRYQNRNLLMKSFLLFLLGISLVGCVAKETNADQAHLFADYYVRFLQTEQQVKAYATFLEGDSLETAQPAPWLEVVNFQGNQMEARSIGTQSKRFVYNGAANFTNGFTFTYKDKNKKEQKITIPMPGIQDFSVLGVASKANGMSIQLSGPDIAENESLILLFTDSRNASSTIPLPGPIKMGGTLTLPASYLRSVSLGKNKLYLVRNLKSITRTLEQDITIESEFYSKTVELQVVE